MPYTDTKQGGDFGIDKNEVPVGFRWRVLRKFTDDAGAVLGETTVYVPFTKADLEIYVTPALAARDADIATDRAEMDAVKAKLKAAVDALKAVTAADQSWDTTVRTAVGAVLADNP